MINVLQEFSGSFTSQNDVSKGSGSGDQSILRTFVSNLIASNRADFQIEYINPDSVFKSPAFSQAVVTSASAKRIIIGMQNSVNARGEIVGKGDLAAQVAQTLANIEACLQAAGTSKENITIMRIYLLDGQEMQAGFAAFQKWASKTTPPPANTAFWVPRLHNPDLLVGVEVEAIIP